MLTFLLTIHIILALAMIGVILLQKGDSGGLTGGGNQSFMSVRGKSNFFTHITAILAALFMGNCLALAVISRHVGKTDLTQPVVEQSSPAVPANKSQESK